MSERMKLPGVRTILKDNIDVKKGMRLGTVVEKGVSLTSQKMEVIADKLAAKVNFYSVYPDLYIDELVNPTDSNFELLFTQRILMRSMMRYKKIHVTAARGFSKTFISVLVFIIKCIFQPGSVIAITAPTKKQASEVANQKVTEILSRFPLLQNEIHSRTAGKDYMVIKFKNGSTIEVTAALESTRGRRFHGVLVDELRDQDGDNINSILLPTLVISRRTAGKGILNSKEPHQMQIFTTSASSKSSYNYEKLLEIFMDSIIQPKSSIIFGFDYRIPIAEKLIDSRYIQDMKLSNTFKPNDFAREFLSIYTSDNEDSWFNFTQLSRHRKIVNAEWSQKNVVNPDFFYLLAVDVGRFHDQTVVTVFKVRPSKGKYLCKVVNIYVLGRTDESRQFSEQVKDIKRIIRAFNPIEVVIDINGLGASVADQMILPHFDNDGSILPPYGFSNDESYRKIQPMDAPRILYGIKASAGLNSQMFSNCYSKIQSGQIDFLITEREARSKLLATQRGQKMSAEEKTKRLMPYEMTSKLFDEMGNLRMKAQGGMNIVLEQINTRFPKDKFSSLIMGLWRIKELEDAQLKNFRRRGNGEVRNLIFYSGGR